MTSPIDTSLIPAQIRAEGPKAEKLYSSALQFEQMLVQQLAQGLTDATKTDDSSDDSGDDGTSDTSSQASSGLGVYQDMLPDALAKSVTSGGGMGLALSLYHSMGGTEQTAAKAADTVAAAAATATVAGTSNPTQGGGV
jgi:Rod binding domain-containing protein